MKNKLFIVLCVAIFVLKLSLTAQNSAKEDVLLQTLKIELNRNMQEWKTAEIPVYFISYRVDEIHSYSADAIFGNLTDIDSSFKRYLTVQIRIGDDSLDNFHNIKKDAEDYLSSHQTVLLPFTFDEKVIAQILWKETDNVYRLAFDRYKRIKSNMLIQTENEDLSPDFSEATSNQYYEAPIPLTGFYLSDWVVKLRAMSKPFAADTNILKGSANFRYTINRKYYVNSEETEVVHNQSYSFLTIQAETQAEDGMLLPLYNTYFQNNPFRLPQEKEIENDTKILIDKLLKLRISPVADAYLGPALLSNEAAGIFLHEILGHRIEGSQLKSDDDRHTLKKKLGQSILNKDISVFFDPTLIEYQGFSLCGSFLFDDEGVKSKKINVVEQGVLKNFLMTRTPVDNMPHSNAHARAAAGLQPVSRQSNLLIESSHPYSDKDLRNFLIEEAQKQGLSYAYWFAKVQGEFATTKHYCSNSVNIIPLEVYRIYTDGRPDELVRGVDLVGTPLTVLSHIEKVGDKYAHFAGSCEAKSGSIPVSCCSPAILLKQIETQKKAISVERPPILSRNIEVSTVESLPEEIIFEAMQSEIERNMRDLKFNTFSSPFYIGYMIADAQIMCVESSLGSIKQVISKPARTLEVDVLQGDYLFNNLNFIDETDLFENHFKLLIPVSLDNHITAIRNSLWHCTDQRYKQTALKFENKKTAVFRQTISQKDQEVHDFAPVPVRQYDYNMSKNPCDIKNLEELTKSISAVFKNYPDIVYSGADIYAYISTVYYLNSESIKYILPFDLIGLKVYATTVSENGEELTDFFTTYAKKMEFFPAYQTLIEQAREMANRLTVLRKANSVSEICNAPVLFTGEAVGELIAQAFIENDDGLLAGRKSLLSNPQMINPYSRYSPHENTIGNKWGKKVFSSNLTVTEYDNLTDYQDIQLLGSYIVDAEGIAPKPKITLIKDGILQNLLSDRIPIPQIEESNGHKRFALTENKLTTSLCAGVMEVSTKQAFTYKTLKKKLIALAKAAKYDYAYIVEKIFPQHAHIPNTDMYLYDDQSIKTPYIIQISVKDGTETIFRGAKLNAINLKSFKQGIMASNRQQVYNTLLHGRNKNLRINNDFKMSGSPVSLIIPSALLFPDLEVEPDPGIVLQKQPTVKSPMK